MTQQQQLTHQRRKQVKNHENAHIEEMCSVQLIICDDKSLEQIQNQKRPTNQKIKNQSTSKKQPIKKR